MNTRTRKQAAFDGVQTMWTPSTPTLRDPEVSVGRSMDGIVSRRAVDTMAIEMHRQAIQSVVTRTEEPVQTAQDALASFMKSMDGIRVQQRQQMA